jgi:hypothetical protein
MDDLGDRQRGDTGRVALLERRDERVDLGFAAAVSKA